MPSSPGYTPDHHVELAKSIYFQRFAELLDVTIDVEEILDRCFAVLPPFTGGKKYEFKDAILIASLHRWAELNEQTVLVISNDDGLKAACTGLLESKELPEVLADCIQRGAYGDYRAKASAYLESTISNFLYAPVELVLYNDDGTRSSLFSSDLRVREWGEQTVIDATADTVVIERVGVGEPTFIVDSVVDTPDRSPAEPKPDTVLGDPMKAWFEKHAPAFGVWLDDSLDEIDESERAEDQDWERSGYVCGPIPLQVQFTIKKTHDIHEPFRVTRIEVLEPRLVDVIAEPSTKFVSRFGRDRSTQPVSLCPIAPQS